MNRRHCIAVIFGILVLTQHIVALPSVSSHTPAKNALNVSQSVNITVTFNEAMNQATLTNSTIKVNGSQSGLHTSVSITYDTGTNTATFDPTNDFKVGEVVSVTLTVGIQNGTGTPLANPYCWNFTVAVLSGVGTFSAKADYPAGTGARSVIAADLDNDGDNDLAAVNPTAHTLSVLKNNGNGTFGAKNDFSSGTSPNVVFSADLDGDGDMDVTAADNSSGSSALVLKNNGDGTLATAVGYSAGSSAFPFSIFSADLDGDGDLDLVTANQGTDNISVIKNNGDGTFATKVNYPAGTTPYSVYAADLDGDGDMDVVTANLVSDDVSVFKNNGDGTFAAAVTYSTGNLSNPYSVYAADLDGDGDMDLAVACSNTLKVAILKNNGNGTFAAHVDYTTGSSPTSVFAADIDGDGDMDLVVANSLSTTVSVLKNNGNATFATKVDYTTGSGPQSVYCADLDGDGDLDLIVANNGTNNVSVLLNNSIVLPVELSSFRGRSNQLTAELQWMTASEVNNYGFEVQRRIQDTGVRSQDENEEWKVTGFVDGAGTSNIPKQYSFTDFKLSAGKYLYRLKQIDRNGAFTFSQSLEVQVGVAASVFELGQNFPNPFNPTTTIDFTIPNDGRVTLKIYNTLGQLAATLLDEDMKAGEYHRATFDGSTFSSGIYFARLESNGKQGMKKILMTK